MKNHLSKFLFFLMALAMVNLAVVSCGGGETDNDGVDSTQTDGNTAGNTDDGAGDAVTDNSNLTDEQKGANLMQNSSLIFAGVFLVSFSEVADDMTTGMAEAFGAGDKVKITDENVAKMTEDMLGKLGEVNGVLRQKFDSVRTADPEKYSKLFGHESFADGIANAESRDLPEGFPPLTYSLTTKELHRYIVYTASQPDDGSTEDDPIVASVQDATKWVMEFSQAVKDDPELNETFAALTSKK